MPACVIGLLLLAAVLFSFNAATHTSSVWVMSAMLFAIGFLLFGPDSLIVGTAAVDFGTKKGASTAVGVINGFGSTGAILGGSLPGIISQRYGWDILFYSLAVFALMAGLLLLPKWNAMPASRRAKE
jgi:OPA family sugar phosphate sensor protein UhpC-like MFS transporter